MDLGIPGPDAGKGGKHLVLPPGYGGDIPDGYFIGRSSSFKVLLAVRALPIGGDLDAALAALQAVKVYPLTTAASPALTRIVDMTGRELDNSSLRWETNIGYWNVLHQIIDAEPIVNEFRPMYGLLSALGIEKGKPFDPGERMRSLLARAATVGRDQMLVSAFASSRPDRRVARPDVGMGRTGPRQRRFRDPNRPRSEPIAGSHRQSSPPLRCSAARKAPALSTGSPPATRPVPSSTADEATDSTSPNRYPEALLVTDHLRRPDTLPSQDLPEQGSPPLTLRAPRHSHRCPGRPPHRANAPQGDTANRWIKTTPGQGWFAYLRIYGPEAPAFDGTWSLPDFEPIN